MGEGVRAEFKYYRVVFESLIQLLLGKRLDRCAGRLVRALPFFPELRQVLALADGEFARVPLVQFGFGLWARHFGAAPGLYFGECVGSAICPERHMSEEVFDGPRLDDSRLYHLRLRHRVDELAELVP
jgi:hypothetical protein